jgi:ATP-dependent helicase/nuclease subunit A
MAAAAFGVLEDERFAAVFGPGSRAEVALAGDQPPAAEGPGDFRPGRPAGGDGGAGSGGRLQDQPPLARPIEDADPAYLAQMAVYAAVLREVFPDRPVEAALVWTDGPKLMPVPEKVMSDALARMARPLPGGAGPYILQALATTRGERFPLSVL